MSDAGERKQLGGLARSIDALFAGRDPESEAGRASVEVEEVPRRDEASEADGPQDVDASLRPRQNGAAEVRPAADVAPAEPAPRFAARDDEEEARVAQVEALLAEVEEAGPASGEGPEESRGPDAHALSSRLVGALAAERDDGRRERLTAACVHLGGPSATALAEALAATDDRFARRAFVDALVAMGPAARPVVEGMMEDERWFVVRNGVALLGEIGGGHALELLTGALAHQEPRVRRDALMALSKLGGEDAGQLAFGMLDDPDTGVRQAAASAVGALDVQRAVRPLIRMLDQEDDPDLIVAVLRSLGQLGDPGAVHAIERHAVGSFLRRPPPDVRIAAYRALRHIGTPHARRLLNQAVDDRDPAVKAAVRQMLGMA